MPEAALCSMCVRTGLPNYAPEKIGDRLTGGTRISGSIAPAPWRY